MIMVRIRKPRYALRRLSDLCAGSHHSNNLAAVPISLQTLTADSHSFTHSLSLPLSPSPTMYEVSYCESLLPALSLAQVGSSGLALSVAEGCARNPSLAMNPRDPAQCLSPSVVVVTHSASWSTLKPQTNGPAPHEQLDRDHPLPPSSHQRAHPLPPSSHQCASSKSRARFHLSHAPVCGCVCLELCVLGVSPLSAQLNALCERRTIELSIVSIEGKTWGLDCVLCALHVSHRHLTIVIVRFSNRRQQTTEGGASTGVLEGGAGTVAISTLSSPPISEKSPMVAKGNDDHSRRASTTAKMAINYSR
jgi:hypothetical protein